MPNEDIYEGDTSPEPDKDNVYEGNIAEDPVALKGVSSGLQPPTVDELIQSKVKACDGGFVCMICGSRNRRSDSMRRHMREIHLSTDEDYHCPPCNKYFKNKTNIYTHIKSNHKDWKGVNYEYFRVNSLPRPMPL